VTTYSLELLGSVCTLGSPFPPPYFKGGTFKSYFLNIIKHVSVESDSPLTTT
jgi:hypothetical protein